MFLFKYIDIIFWWNFMKNMDIWYDSLEVDFSKIRKKGFSKILRYIVEIRRIYYLNLLFCIDSYLYNYFLK